MQPSEIDLKNPASSAPAQRIDRPLALVFTDMVGSSAAKRAASLGGNSTDRDAAFLESVQSLHLHQIRECVAAHRGKEIMTIGDAFFLTFEDPRSALLCSAEIHMRLKAQPIMTAIGPLQLRIGIHVGIPQYFENSWHGRDVDTAARTEAVGSPDQIVVTEAAQEAIGAMPGVVFRPLGTFEIKGVGTVSLLDADYDGHGARKPRVESLESVKRRNWLSLARKAATVLLAAGLATGGYFLLRPNPKLRITDKDKLVVADFDNTTGDPVFDSTLKKALDIQLEQSPYLLLVSDSELRSDLRSLGHPVDQKITPALAREIGQREGIKAYLSGSVSSLGSAYVVSLHAINCATDEVFAREQVEAQDRPHVLSAIATAAADLRAKLGESLSSIQRLSTPDTEVTTSSLEAFHAFALGEEEHMKGNNIPEAETYYKRAIELDPAFAMAWARLGVIYSNFGSSAQAMEYMNKAMDLRQRTTGRERIYIESETATQQQNMPKALELFKTYTSTYPRDTSAWNNLAIVYQNTGELEQSAEAFERSYGLASWDEIGATNSALALLAIDRLPEAKHYLDQARVQGGIDNSEDLAMDMVYAFLSGAPDWRRQLATAANLPDGFFLDAIAGSIDLFQGRMADARTDLELAVRRAQKAKVNDSAASFLANHALAEAQLGDCKQATGLIHRAAAMDRSLATIPDMALTLTLCGKQAEGLSDIEKLAKDNPANSLVNPLSLAEAKAAAAISQHHPERVKPLLEELESYGPVSYIPYLEGLAFMEQKKPREAIAALAPARRWRGTYLLMSNGGNLQTTLYPVALLMTARAQVLAGDKADAAKTYQQLLAEWKNADANFKPAQDARRELAALE